MSIEIEPGFDMDYLPYETRCDLRLWAAVFRQAVDDCVDAERYFNTPEHIRSEAGKFSDYRRILAWLDSDEDSVGSFTWLCDLFNVDAGRLRKRIRGDWENPRLGTSVQLKRYRKGLEHGDTNEATHLPSRV